MPIFPRQNPSSGVIPIQINVPVQGQQQPINLPAPVQQPVAQTPQPATVQQPASQPTSKRSIVVPYPLS